MHTNGPKDPFSFFAGKTSSVLDRRESVSSTPLQNQADQLVSSFLSQATDWKSLAAMTAGGMAYRWGKISLLNVGAIHESPLLARPLSITFGLTTEVTAFELTHRTLTTLTERAGLKPAPTNNLWTWSGPDGWKEGLLNSLVTFGTLKGFGTLAQGQNLLLQHGVQDLGMVLGHQLTSQVGLSEKPEGNLGEQLLRAETTNLQFSAGLSLAHQITGGRLMSWEKGLDVLLSSKASAHLGENRGGGFLNSFTPALTGTDSPTRKGIALDFNLPDPKISAPLLMISQEGEKGSGPKTIEPPKEGERSEVEIEGWIDLNQFYGKGGGSDADTTKLKISETSLKVRKGPKEEWRPGKPGLLEGAHVRGKPVIDPSGRLTLRLQAVDAPELHYPAQPVKPLEEASEACQARWENGLFRQHGAYRATLAVVGMLSTFASSKQPDRVRARAHAWIGSPNDLFDVYGRFVSELLLGPEGESLNLWLLKKGWALPAFYNSMSAEEIQISRAAAQSAREKGLGLWPDYAEKLTPFDPNLRLPRGEEDRLQANQDHGPFILPKLFRRMIHYEVNRRAGLLRLRSLTAFLEARKEKWLPTELYLKGATSKDLRLLSEIVDKKGKVLYSPEEMTFMEKPSSLSDAKDKEIESLE